MTASRKTYAHDLLKNGASLAEIEDFIEGQPVPEQGRAVRWFGRG